MSVELAGISERERSREMEERDALHDTKAEIARTIRYDTNARTYGTNRPRTAPHENHANTRTHRAAMHKAIICFAETLSPCLA